MARQRNHFIILLVGLNFFLHASVSQSIKDTVCKDVNTESGTVAAKDAFKFIFQFQARVEGVAPTLQRIIHADMSFSQMIKMLRVNIFSDDWEYHTFHDYKTHETSTYSTYGGKPRSCKVDPKMRGGRGFYLVPNDIPEGGRPEVANILRLTGQSGFGTDIQLVQSPDPVVFRDLTCTEYVSCQKFFDENGDEMVLKVTHLISDTKFIKAEGGTVPVQIRLEGQYATGSNQGKPVSFIYNIYHYKKMFARNFEYPLGVVCEDKKTVREFPELPEYMSFGQETHYPDRKRKIETIETSFDSVRNYVQETYFNPDGSLRNRRLDDFNSGLSFNVDGESGKCIVKRISEASKINDFARSSGGSIEMVTPQQFFHSGGIQFHYNGERKFDFYLTTEEWSGKDKNSGQIYTWFFTKNVSDSLNHYAKVFKGQPYRIPHKRMVWDNEESEPTNTYFYKVDFTIPEKKIHTTNCFKGSPKHINIYLPGLEMDQLEKDEALVKRRVENTLVEALGIMWLRINYINVYFYGELGFASFSLLGEPEVEGDKVIGAKNKKEPTLEEAYNLLKKKLDDGLSFNVGNDDELIMTQGLLSDPPFRKSFELHSGNSEGSLGYSSGALAGLAIGMIILGLIAGGIVGFLYFFKLS